MDERQREEAYWLSRCISCGSCVDACPQVNPQHPDNPEAGGPATFIGAAPISWARFMNLQDIPLMESIASMNRQITRHLLVDWLKE